MRVSFEIPEYTADVVAVGAVRLLEAIRRTGIQCRFYRASSSAMFGGTPPPQCEASALHPRSPYACAKVFAHNTAVNYRESCGMHASCGILFNHESPRRGETFVTRKITRAVAQIHLGLQEKLYLGNLDARTISPVTCRSSRAIPIFPARLKSAPADSPGKATTRQYVRGGSWISSLSYHNLNRRSD